ncbi:MAG: AsnC family protein [Nitrososphaerota archaeon]
MSSLTSLRRRNQDYLLVETIKQVGIANYSLIARLTGLNAETVRYRVNRHLQRLGLKVMVNLNFGELGFSSGFMVMVANYGSNDLLFGKLHYLLFSGKAVGLEKYYCVFSVPYRLKKKYYEFILTLKQEALLQDYEMIELDWLRFPPFRAEFYDFGERKWKIDWNRLDLIQNESGVMTSYLERDSKVDEFDLKILRSMQEEPTISIAKIAKATGMNPRTIRYHHLEHVVKKKLILGNNIRWVAPYQSGKSSDLMQAVFIFRKVEKVGAANVRKVFNRLPFTWLEGGKEEGSYVAFVDIPIELFHETMKYIEERLSLLSTKPEIVFLDSTKRFQLECEIFDKKWGWSLPGYVPNTSAIVGEKNEG